MLAAKADEAEAEYELACKLCPEAWLGIACEELRDGNRVVAIKRFDQVLRHATEEKTRAVALCNYGMVLNNSGNRKASEPYFRESFALWKRADTATNLALCRLYDHDLEDANRWIDIAIRLEPANHTVWFNKALITLISGDLLNGFRQYESRWKNPQSKTKKLPIFRKEWNGEPLAGKTLLVYAEQGAGDTIQMLRYGPALKQLGCRLMLAPQIGLAELAETQGCWDEVFPNILDNISNGNVPAYDFHVPAMSLPRLFRTTLENIPASPYLSVKGTFPVEHSKLNIGFVWAGSVDHAHDLWRSTLLDDWAPLFGIPGTAWHSFQIGPRTIELLGTDYPIHDISGSLKTYLDSAQAVMAMDLIIAVDTSLVHLAGALGKPCWMLTPFSPDWRWLFDREDSPWYSSVRLFRQKEEFGWMDVIERVKRAILQQIERRGDHQ